MKNDGLPYRDSSAARILTEAIKRASGEGRSQRQLAKDLGYRESVVLSHMASGRVQIPIDRVPQLANELGIDEAQFALAVLQQRHPTVNWASINTGSVSSGDDEFVMDLAASAGGNLAQLTSGQRRVIREVVADPQAHRRWLTVHEIAAIEAIRRAKPDVVTEGLTRAETSALERTLLK